MSPMGEKANEALRLQFDRWLSLGFHGARIISDGALPEGFGIFQWRGQTPQGGLPGFKRGLTALGLGPTIGARRQEGWARHYQELIWEIPASASVKGLLISS